MANPALIDELEKQFRDNPRRVFARLANEYRKAGDFMRAIEICSAHVPQQPGYISGHIVLGQALFDAGEADQAQQTFQTALALDPENLIALRQLGDLARNRRDFHEARTWYTRLLEVDPQNDEVVAQLGELALADEDSGLRSSGDAHDRSQAEPSHDAVATAVADEPGDHSGLALAEIGGSVRDADAGERDLAALHGISFALDDVGGAPHDQHNGMDPQDTRALDIDDAFGGDAQQQVAAGLAPAAGTPDALLDDDHELDVAWIALDEDSSDADAAEGEFFVEQVMEADDTEMVIASDPRDSEARAEPASGTDFGVTFEPEEFDVPLRPHTGESLAVIPEEDALAGIQPLHNMERSPFGEAVGGDDRDDESHVAFEPLPLEDIDAAAEAEAASEPVGGLSLMDEMGEWAVEATDDAPATNVVAPDVGETAAERASLTTERDEVEAAPAPAAEHEDEQAIDLGDPATLIEEPADELSWDEPVAAAETSAAEPAFQPIEDSADDEFGWDLPELDAEPAASAARPVTAAEPEMPDEPQMPNTPEMAAEAEHEPRVEQPAEGPAEPVNEVLTAAEPPAEPAAQEPATPAFVTETMAELYLKQGFRNEALAVYRKLSAQWPGDEVFRARIAELEQGSVPEVASEGGDSASTRPSMQRPAAAFFKSLASIAPPPVDPPPAAPSDGFAAWANGALSEAGEVSEADDSAAMALASGFGPDATLGSATRAADQRMSLNDIFGPAERSERAGTPGSMDAFFTPEGERASAPPDEEGREDLEAFNAWLEGLKK